MRTTGYLYKTDSTDVNIHLTNQCHQIQNENYGKFQEGNTLPLKEIFTYVNSVDNSVDPDYLQKFVMQKIQDLIIDSVLSVRQSMIITKKTTNFQLFGYDFLIDEDYRVWLIECNTNPYLGIPNDFIKELLPQMIDDMLKIVVDPIFPPKEQNRTVEQMFDLIYCQPGSVLNDSQAKNIRSPFGNSPYPYPDKVQHYVAAENRDSQEIGTEPEESKLINNYFSTKPQNPGKMERNLVLSPIQNPSNTKAPSTVQNIKNSLQSDKNSVAPTQNENNQSDNLINIKSSTNQSSNQTESAENKDPQTLASTVSSGSKQNSQSFIEDGQPESSSSNNINYLIQQNPPITAPSTSKANMGQTFTREFRNRNIYEQLQAMLKGTISASIDQFQAQISNLFNQMLNWELMNEFELDLIVKTLNLANESRISFLLVEQENIDKIIQILHSENIPLKIQMIILEVLQSQTSNISNKIQIASKQVIEALMRITLASCSEQESENFDYELRFNAVEVLTLVGGIYNQKVFIPGETRDNNKIRKIFIECGGLVTLLYVGKFAIEKQIRKTIQDYLFNIDMKDMETQVDFLNQWITEEKSFSIERLKLAIPPDSDDSSKDQDQQNSMPQIQNFQGGDSNISSKEIQKVTEKQIAIKTSMPIQTSPVSQNQEIPIAGTTAQTVTYNQQDSQNAQASSIELQNKDNKEIIKEENQIQIDKNENNDVSEQTLVITETEIKIDQNPNNVEEIKLGLSEDTKLQNNNNNINDNPNNNYNINISTNENIAINENNVNLGNAQKAQNQGSKRLGIIKNVPYPLFENLAFNFDVALDISTQILNRIRENERNQQMQERQKRELQQRKENQLKEQRQQLLLEQKAKLAQKQLQREKEQEMEMRGTQKKYREQSSSEKLNHPLQEDENQIGTLNVQTKGQEIQVDDQIQNELNREIKLDKIEKELYEAVEQYLAKTQNNQEQTSSDMGLNVQSNNGIGSEKYSRSNSNNQIKIPKISSNKLLVKNNPQISLQNDHSQALFKKDGINAPATSQNIIRSASQKQKINFIPINNALIQRTSTPENRTEPKFFSQNQQKSTSTASIANIDGMRQDSQTLLLNSNINLNEENIEQFQKAKSNGINDYKYDIQEILQAPPQIQTLEQINNQVIQRAKKDHSDIQKFKSRQEMIINSPYLTPTTKNLYIMQAYQNYNLK